MYRNLNVIILYFFGSLTYYYFYLIFFNYFFMCTVGFKITEPLKGHEGEKIDERKNNVNAFVLFHKCFAFLQKNVFVFPENFCICSQIVCAMFLGGMQKFSEGT